MVVPVVEIVCAALPRLVEMPALGRTDAGPKRTGIYKEPVAGPVRLGLEGLEPGTLEAGLEIDICDRLHPAWTVGRASDVMAERKRRPEEAAELAELKGLSEAWREELRGTCP